MQERQGHGEIKACTPLRKIRGGEIHRNAAVGKGIASSIQLAMDPVSQIAKRSLGSSRHLKRGQTAAQAHLHLHQRCGHARRRAAVDRAVAHGLGGFARGRRAFERV